MPRALVLSLGLLFAAAGCNKEGPEDPAIAAPGAGIPLGAVSAAGVSFDAPSARPEPVAPRKPSKSGKPPTGIAPVDPLAPDPFDAPPDDDDPAPPKPSPQPAPKPKPVHKPHSPSETTL